MPPIVAGLVLLLTGALLGWSERDRKAKRERRAWDEERQDSIQRELRLFDHAVAERTKRLAAESRVHWLTRALAAEREEQDAGERWKRGRRPAELDDRDRQGH